MKRLGKVMLILLVAVCAALAFTACGSVQSISISKTDAPRITYVQGQELDLSQGKINYTDKSGEHEIALNAKGVKVSGYNKNQLGWQDLTVKYGGETMTFGVNVVERMVFDAGVVTDYFVGESFNTKVGAVKVTFDNGESTSVNLSDPAISVSGFDSSSAKTNLNVTVRYNSGSDDYSYNLAVNIYSVSESGLSVADSAKTVYSHEDINLSGSTVTLSNGTLSKTVDLTKDMLSGYNPSAVNIAAPTAEQTVKVTYAGKEIGSFTVSVTYSDVSLVFDAVNAVSNANLDFSGNNIPSVSAEAGEVAAAAMNAYFSMSTYEKASIAKSDLNKIVCAAAVYCNESVKTLLASGFKSLVIENGEFKVSTSASKQDVKDDIQAFKQGATVEYGDLLAEIKSEFGGLNVSKTLTVNDYVGDTSASSVSEVYDLLEYLVYFDESIVGTYNILNWSSENSSVNASQLLGVFSAVADNGYGSRHYRYYDMVLSGWNGGTAPSNFTSNADCMFTWLYVFCLSNGLDLTYLVPENVYYAYVNLQRAATAIYGNLDKASTEATNKYYSADNSEFMYYMNYATEYYDSFDETDYDIFQYFGISIKSTAANMDGTYVATGIYNVCLNAYYGYLDAWLDDEEMLAFWNIYYGCIDYLSLNVLSSDIPLLFESFAKLSPDRQLAFLSAMHDSYGKYGRALAVTSGRTLPNLFMVMIYNYYADNLSENSFVYIFNNLLMLIEDYATGYGVTGSPENYVKNAAIVKDNYDFFESINSAETDIIDEILGFVYTKYVINIPKELTAMLNYELSEDEQAQLTELAVAMGNVYRALNLMQNGNSYYNLAFSAYLRAEALANDIINSGNSGLVNAYYYYNRLFNDGTSLSTNMETIKVIFAHYAKTVTVGGVSLFDMFGAENGKLKEFYAISADVMWSIADSSVEVSADTVKESMRLFMELDDSDKSAVFALATSDTVDVYFGGLRGYFTVLVANGSQLDNAIDSVFDALECYLEYLGYAVDGNEPENPSSYVETMWWNMTRIEIAIDGFNADDKEFFNEYFADYYKLLQEFYDYLTDTYGDYNAASEASALVAA